MTTADGVVAVAQAPAQSPSRRFLRLVGCYYVREGDVHAVVLGAVTVGAS